MEERTVFGNKREGLGEADPVSFSPTTGNGFVRPFSTGEPVAGRVEPGPDIPWSFFTEQHLLLDRKHSQ